MTYNLRSLLYHRYLDLTRAFLKISKHFSIFFPFPGPDPPFLRPGRDHSGRKTEKAEGKSPGASARTGAVPILPAGPPDAALYGRGSSFRIRPKAFMEPPFTLTDIQDLILPEKIGISRQTQAHGKSPVFHSPSFRVNAMPTALGPEFAAMAAPIW